MGSLQKMLDIQKELNCKIIAKLVHSGNREDYLTHIINNTTPEDAGAMLFDPKLVKQAKERMATDSSRAFWCRTYAQALLHEVVEFIEGAGFKFWSNDELCDEQNLKVEVIDMLHFWLSLCLLLGMDEEDIVNIYRQKVLINKERSDSGTYSRENKTEDDNKSIQTEKMDEDSG